MLENFRYLYYSIDHVKSVSNFAVEKIAQILYDRGLDKEVSTAKAISVFSNDLDKASLYLYNLQTKFSKEMMDKFYNYIAQRAFMNQIIKLTSYDTLIGMIQMANGGFLDTTDRKKVEAIAQANKYTIGLKN